MLTVFIDPGLNDPEQLTAVAADLKRRAACTVVCFFNQHQAEFFKSRTLAVQSFGHEEWPLDDRKVLMERIMQGFNDQHDKPYGTVTVTIDRQDYDLNIFRFLSINTFLKNLIIPVAKTLSLLTRQGKLEKCLVIGSQAFHHHVTYCLQRLNHKDTAECILMYAHRKTRQGNGMLMAIKALVRLVSILVASRVAVKPAIIIPSGQMTDALARNGDLKRKFTIVRSLGGGIDIFKRFSSGQTDRVYSTVNLRVKEVLAKEKAGHEGAIQLAFDTWFDYLQQGQLKQDVRACIALIRVLNIVKPELVVQYNFTGDAHPYTMWCSVHAVKTVCVQHGFQGKFDFSIKYDVESDVYLAWASLPVDMERNAGVSIEVVGNPGYISSEKNEPSPINGRCKILIAPTGLPHMKADADWEFWNLITSFLVQNLENFEVTVKFHHKDRFKELVTEKLEKVVPGIRFTNNPIQKASAEANIIVTTVSTVALDTFFINRPVIIMNNAKEAEYFSAFNACPVLYSLKELEAEVIRLVKDKEYFHTRIQNQQKMVSRFEGSGYAGTVVKVLLRYLDKNRDIAV
jgi:hypothetical protein